MVEKTVRGDDFETGLVMAIGPAYASLPSPPWQRMAMPTTMTHAAIMKSTTFAAPTGAPEVLRVTTLIAMPKAHAPIAIPRRASHGRTASGRESASQSSSARLLEDCISVDQTVRVPTVKLPRSSAHGRTACCLSMGGGGFVGGSTAPPQRRRAATRAIRDLDEGQRELSCKSRACIWQVSKYMYKGSVTGSIILMH